MRGTGVVVEIAGKNRVIVMTSHGEFVSVPFKKAVVVGQELSYDLSRPRTLMQWSAAAVLFLAVVGSLGWNQGLLPIFGNGLPEFFVTLELNPGIELAVSRSKRVVAATGLNSDGEQLLAGLRVNGRPFKQAVEIITAALEAEGYLVDGGREVVVTISTPGTEETRLASKDGNSQNGKNNSITQELEQVVRETFVTHYRAEVMIWQVPTHVRDAAALEGLTPAHYVSIYITTTESPGQPTVVAATVEHQGRTQSFEFAVRQPSLTPASWSQTEHPFMREAAFPAAEYFSQTSWRGDRDVRE